MSAMLTEVPLNLHSCLFPSAMHLSSASCSTPSNTSFRNPQTQGYQPQAFASRTVSVLYHPRSLPYSATETLFIPCSAASISLSAFSATPPASSTV